MGLFRPLARGVFVAFCLAYCTGCQTIRRLTEPPAAGSARLTLPSGPTAAQSGDAKTPAELSSFKGKASLPIPQGSRVEIPTAAPKESPASPQPAAAVTLAAPSVLTIETTGETARAQTTHAPPAPPTPADLAAGQGIRIFFYLAAALALAALALFYFGHTKAAILAVFGAGGLPMLAQVGANLASHAATGILVGIVALVAAWYFVKHRIPTA